MTSVVNTKTYTFVLKENDYIFILKLLSILYENHIIYTLITQIFNHFNLKLKQ